MINEWKRLGMKHDGKSLKETIVSMVKRGETQTKEFQILLEFFGREKIERLWKEYAQETKERKPDVSKTEPDEPKPRKRDGRLAAAGPDE